MSESLANPQETPAFSFFSEVEQGKLIGERGIYTGKLLKERDPAKYEKICKALALGLKKDQIRKAFDVAWETVDAISQEISGGAIREHKKELVGIIGAALRKGAAGIAERADKMTALEFGILLDKWLTLNGEASAITEHRNVDMTPEGFLAWSEAHMRDVTPAQEMHSDGGKIWAKEGADLAIEEAVSLAPVSDFLEAEIMPKSSSGDGLSPDKHAATLV